VFSIIRKWMAQPQRVMQARAADSHGYPAFHHQRHQLAAECVEATLRQEAEDRRSEANDREAWLLPRRQARRQPVAVETEAARGAPRAGAVEAEQVVPEAAEEAAEEVVPV